MLSFLPGADSANTGAYNPSLAPTQRQSQAGLANNPAPLSYSPNPLKEHLLSFAKQIETENDSERKVRVQSMYSMCRRFRGQTPSDLFGMFNKDGVWLEHDSFATLHGTNIFQSLIRGAEANFTQAGIKLKMTAQNNNFQNRATEKVMSAIYESLNEKEWTETTEAEMFYAAILKCNYFVLTRFNKGKGAATLPQPEFETINYETGGLYVCGKCYHSDNFSSVQDTSECAKCGNPNLTVIDDPKAYAEDVPASFKPVPAGEMETIIADGFDFEIDDTDGTNSDITKAKWAEWHFLCDKDELKRLYPHLKLEQKPKWSYGTRWKMALKRYSSSEVYPKEKFDLNQYEMRYIWLDKSKCESYVAPENFQLGSFSIQKGQRLSDVCPDGCIFGVVNDELAFIDNENKNDVLSAGCWLADPLSFWGLGARAGLNIQKKINQLDNINMEGIARALRGAIVYDPEAIAGASLEGANTNIPLRKGFDRKGEAIESFFRAIDVSGLSSDSMIYLTNQFDLMQKIMGVPDAALGESDEHNQTLGGQQLLAQRAVGLLIPAKKSQGRAKELWFVQQAKGIQRYYSNERIKQFGLRFGEEILDDEIEAFRAADLDRDVMVKYVEGSEVPVTREVKEQKLVGMVAEGLVPLTPKVSAKLADIAGVGDDIDVGFYRKNMKLAQKRFTYLKETLEFQPFVEMQYRMMEASLIDPVTGARALDPVSGTPVVNPIVLMISNDSELDVNAQAEGHAIQFEFWQEKYLELKAAGTPQLQVLIAMCDFMMTKHQTANFMQIAKDMTLQGLAQMPAAMGEQMVNQSGEQNEQGKGKQAGNSSNKPKSKPAASKPSPAK